MAEASEEAVAAQRDAVAAAIMETSMKAMQQATTTVQKQLDDQYVSCL